MLAQGVVKVLLLDLLELRSNLNWSLGEGIAHFADADVSRITATWLENRRLLARQIRREDDWAAVARVFQTALVWESREGDRLDQADTEALKRWLERLDHVRDMLEAWPRRVTVATELD
jgi:hypothetical protein